MAIPTHYVYVYHLDGTPVYVGKGHGGRGLSHLTECYDEATPWHRFLKKCLKQGLKPEFKFLAQWLDEDEAYRIESKYIEIYGLEIDGTGTLKNTRKEPETRKNNFSTGFAQNFLKRQFQILKITS